ncbi:MAG: septum formation inhibitor Maf [Clostridia bacterium]|nr:septum formation inhibitor Maf [Clostridia bacterium]
MLILASASPRRREILKQAGMDFEVMVSDIEEKADPSLSPSELVVCLARQKAENVFQRAGGKTVVAADTVVALEGKILGKPKDEKNAFEMLKALSGKTHEVFTGVCVIKDGKSQSFFERTEVDFYPLSDEDISSYIATGEPMDKAGAYGIQGKGCTLVKAVRGDFYNVVGLPIAKLSRLLK